MQQTYINTYIHTHRYTYIYICIFVCMYLYLFVTLLQSNIYICSFHKNVSYFYLYLKLMVPVLQTASYNYCFEKWHVTLYRLKVNVLFQMLKKAISMSERNAAGFSPAIFSHSLMINIFRWKKGNPILPYFKKLHERNY